MPRTFAGYLNGNFAPPNKSQLGGIPSPLEQMQQRLSGTGRFGMMGLGVSGGGYDYGSGFDPMMGAGMNVGAMMRPAFMPQPITRGPAPQPMPFAPGMPTVTMQYNGNTISAMREPQRPAMPGLFPGGMQGAGGIPFLPTNQQQRPAFGGGWNQRPTMMPTNPGNAFLRGGRRPPLGYRGPLPEDGGYGGQSVYPLAGGQRRRPVMIPLTRR